MIATKTERTKIHFISDVLIAAASLDLEVPNIAPALARGINKKKSSKNLLPKSKGCLTTYSHDYSVFMIFQFPQKPTFPNSNLTRNQIDEESLCGCATYKSLFIYFIHFIIQLQSGSTRCGGWGGGENLCSLKDGMRSWPCSCMGM